jgi:hypothetical protein
MEQDRRRGRVRARSTVVAFALSGVLLAPEAAAQTATLAESLFRDARVAMKARDVDRACPLFAESYRLDPAHGTLFNLAACEEERGKLASAWAAYRRLVDLAPAEDDRVIEATVRIRALEERVPRLRLVYPGSLPPEHELELDGVRLGPGALAGLLRVDPGKHVLRVVAAGEAVRTTALEVAVGQTLTHELEPIVPAQRAASNVPPRRDASPARQLASARPPSDPKIAAYTALGLGGAAVGASLLLGALALKAHGVTERHCPNGLCDAEGMAAAERGANYAALATAGAVAGLVGLGAGGLLVLRAGSAEVGLTGTGVRVEGSF